MKFRGKMMENQCIRQFSQLVTLIARLAKVCVIRITSSKIYFIISEMGGSNPGMWAELEQGYFFNEFDMEGVSSENNEIFLELVPDKLAKSLNSLKSSQSTKSLKIKLTKKHSPCLTFEIELPSLSSRSRLVVHDIPITLIPRRLWHLYQEPAMPSYEASIYLPPLKQLRHVVERLKSLSAHATLSANHKGTFIISVATDTVDVSTYFKNLAMPAWGNNTERPENVEDLHSATVDIKKLAQFLQGDQVNPSRVICNIHGGKTVHLFLLHDNITLQYFLPAINTGQI
ncbi:UNVERIFIED_CONTAM: hypothetical protein RMT77_008194 [Armadillidium vulgare]|nr:Checkpoint protein HUS1 [Armadillidium vulgare]